MSTLSTMRRSLSIPRALLMLGGALALLPATVRAQDLEVPGVPVQITGQGYGRSQYGESAELYFEGSGFLAKSPADGSGTVLDLMSETWSTTFVWFNTPKATLQMEPGKTYYVSAWGARITKLWLHIHAPTGYQVEIDGLVRPHLQITGTSHIYTIRLSSPADDLVARAGTASSIAGDRLWWQTALGSLRNGESARSLAIIDSGTSSSWSSIFTPAGLQYQEPSEEIYVHRVSNNIRQIIANEAAVDVVTLSGTSYELRFYNPSQVIGSSGLRTFTGSPFVTYKIEQGGTTTTLKITSTTRNLSTGTTARTAETTLARTGTWPNFNWTRQDWRTSGQTALSEETHVPLSGNTNLARSETLKVQIPAGAIAMQGTRSYAVKAWGEVVTSHTLGTTQSVTANYVYYEDPGHGGSYGSVKSVANNDGSWQAFEYYDAPVGGSFAGTVKRSFRPYLNAPTAVGVDPAQIGEITYFEYATDPFGKGTRPSLVRTTINTGSGAITVAESTTSYSEATFIQNNYAFSMVTASRSDKANASQSLVSTTKFFREDTYDAFFRGQLHSAQRPDGVKQSIAYQHGTWNGSTFTKSGNNGLDPGTASRIAVITGTASTGSAYTLHDGYDIDDLYLVDGKSTMEVTIRNSRALVVRTETHARKNSVWNLVAYANYTYDAAGLLTNKTASNGAQYDSTYLGELKNNETDESGIVLTYGYDVAARVSTITKTSGPTTTLTYNAAGQVLSQTVSADATGTGETLVTSASYDDAGRITSQTQPGLGAATSTYNVAARTHTVTLPVDSATRTETYYADGRLYSITGTAVVPEFRHYTVQSDGKRTEQITPGYTGAPRWTMSWADWLGRPVSTARPGFSKSAQGNFWEDNTFDATTGRLSRTDRTGFAPTRYEYDALGAVTRTGLDAVGGTGLVLASNDRIGDTDQYFESFESAWWVRTDTKTYPFANSATAVTTSTTRKRLTGHPANRLDETRVTDAEGTTTVRTVDVNRGTATVTITTTTPGLANSQVETIVNGLPTSVVSPDSVTVSQQYDALSRPWKSIDPRGKITTTTYKNGSTLVDSVADHLGNTVSHEYDLRGRRTLTTDAASKKTRFAYNLRGQLTFQWGDGSYPVSYGYDDNFGDRTSLNTYRGAPDTDSPTWPAVGTADTTTFTYDAASGLLWKKTDAATKFVEYDYNVRGQTASRMWSRTVPAGLPNAGQRVTSTYAYDPGTGELTGVSYNDSITPAVGYTYTRLGQISTVTDSAGLRTFNYDAATPWRTKNETFDATLYGSRIITHLYNTWSGTGGGYGPYTPGFIKGRYEGFDLGVAGNLARDQHQNYTWANSGRHVGVNTRVTTGSPRDILYYHDIAGSPLITRTETGSLSVARAYEPHRNLLTSIDSKWSGASRTRFDYVTNNRYQRESAKQSGSAFADYGDSTFAKYTYNARGELTDAPSYLGSNIADTSKPLQGRQHAYGYDSIGNRKWTNRTTNAAYKESFFGTTGGTGEGANNLNQYRSRENDAIHMDGAVDAATTTVAVTGGSSSTVSRQQRYWAAAVLVPNSSAPWKGTLTIATTPSGGSTTYENRTAQIAKALEELAYNDDGNLTSDGMWNYVWDAENRLIEMTTTLAAASVGIDNRKLEFKYDYLGRRVQKRVLHGSTFAILSTARYLYQGWNLIAELDGTAALVRSFTWGLDLTGSLTASGGVGALLQIYDHATGKTLLPTYDGNGNVVSLIQAVTVGAVTAGTAVVTYEYDPFGRLLRSTSTGPDDFAKSNPFRFSNKFQDEETGLIYYGHRYYSPSLGRFINRDPIEERGGLNLYGFCGNDGVNNWDYLGQSWLSRFWRKFRHTIISAILYAIPGVGPALSTLYNTAVGAHYGGVKGALLSLAGGGYLGGPLQTAATVYGLYKTFRHGSFLKNVWNWYSNKVVQDTAYQAADYVINGRPLKPSSAMKIDDDPKIDESRLGKHQGTFENRRALDKAVGDLKTGFFAAIKNAEGAWDLYEVDGIYTGLVFVNGIKGTIFRHASLGIDHLGSRFKDVEQFTIAHNSSHGAISDILETAGDLLGIRSKASRQLEAKLKSALEDGRKVTLVAHSQGFATTVSALRSMAVQSFDASGLTIYPHAGAANSFYAGSLARSVNATLMPHAFSSWDFVPSAVGMNGNPLQILGSLVAFPCLMADESKSQHSTVHGGGFTWRTWAPGG